MDKITAFKTILEFILVLTSMVFLANSLTTKITSPDLENKTIPAPNKTPFKKPLLPRRPNSNPNIESITLGGKIAPDFTTEIQIDFPLSEHLSNIGSKKDGAGMCVMSSIEMAGRWSNLESVRGLRDWCAKEAGGAYPSKVDKQLSKYAKEFKLENLPYLQYEGSDTQVLQVALETGRFPAVTYSGKDKVRYTGSISHMVCLAHLDNNYAAIWDNNGKPGELIWMTPSEFKSRWIDGSSGWAFIWLSPPPTPLPRR